MEDMICTTVTTYDLILYYVNVIIGLQWVVYVYVEQSSRPNLLGGLHGFDSDLEIGVAAAAGFEKYENEFDVKRLRNLVIWQRT